MIRFFLPFRPLLKGWLLSFLIFGLLAFVIVEQFVFVMSQSTEEGLRMAARDWLPWAILAPLIFRLVGRLPLDRDRWKVAVPVHLLCCVGAVAFCNWWAETIFPPRFFRGPGGRDGRERFIARRAAEARAAAANNAQTPGSGTSPNAEHTGGTGATEPPSNAPEAAAPPPGAPRSGRPPSGNRPGFGGPRRGRPPAFNAFFVIGFRLPIYIALISAAHAMHFYRRSKERERRSLELEANLAKARLQALTMQLQPHFLFNALNAIAALVHTNPDAADEMLAALSDLLRLTLETSHEQELPLRRELEFVERYLMIEHVRFGDRLQFELDVAPETEAALVPTFLLQPLVENAVRHGLEPRSGNGKLVIRARRDNGSLRLSVEDNGVGLREEKPDREGIGLANTRARLRELYDGAANVELRNRDGLTVELTLPFRIN